MHEAGPVHAAIERAWPLRSDQSGLRIVVRDPTRAEADSVRFYAEALLAERGLSGLDIAVRVTAVRCAACGQRSRPTPRDPTCRVCGDLMPALAGPAIEMAWTDTVRGAPRCA